MTASVLTLTAFLQSQLDVVVISAEFFPAGGPKAVDYPCSLVTIAPFARGGFRRLAINIHSPIIIRAARMMSHDEDSVRILGEIMLNSASWPIKGIDGNFNLQWQMARGLIATPHCLYVSPVPHQIMSRCNGLHTQLIIWPKRITGVTFVKNRGEPCSPNVPQFQCVSTQWELRDEALRAELTQFTKRRGLRSKQQYFTTIEPSTALITFAPSLPVFCVADSLLKNRLLPRHSALAEAANFLIKNDHLFCLSLFFGVPMIDRTGTVHSALKTSLVARPVPTDSDVSDFLSTCHGQSCHDVLNTLMLARATALWEHTEQLPAEGSMYVAWSGGIDSTAALCALLLTAQHQQGRKRRITVLLDDESLSENPRFFESQIREKLRTLRRQGMPLSWHERRIRRQNALNVLVTGELGDQIFGSDRMGAAFPESNGRAWEPPANLAVPALPPPEFRGVFHEKGLASPWEETIFPSLFSAGLASDFDAFRSWIAPQLSKSSFPIVSTFDFLWWLNFSMKWQGVSLRCLHDGGEPLLDHATSIDNLTGCIRHFYDHPSFECWSCTKEFHDAKFPDLTDWKTYKEPLKKFIRDFDGDVEYYQEKTKVGSLSFGAPDGATAYGNRFFGAAVTSQKSIGVKNAHSSKATGSKDQGSAPNILSWGVTGLRFPKEGSLVELLLLTRSIASVRHYPYNSTGSLRVNPWDELKRSPFDDAPYFAEGDERQRRVFNPVTKTTLTGKCAALLPPEIIRDRTLLDLGACLGASSYYALCMGASHVTLVEIQDDFCERAECFLHRALAAGCWTPGNREGGPHFDVVRSGVHDYLHGCNDLSHDVILAAGILHSFLDPIRILLEMARVASYAVLIELTHPSVFVDGFLDDEDEQTGPAVDGLKASVRTLQQEMAGQGLLQVDGSALINMAGTDASFKGLAVFPSRLAIESIMKDLNYDVQRVFLEDHPTENEEVLTYTGPRKYKALPKRFFLRCIRNRALKPQLQSLESRVSTDDKRESVKWISPWREVDERRGASDDQILPTVHDGEGEWRFDERVALRFEREARRHIPDYEAVIDDSVLLLEKELQCLSATKQDIKVVDIGCAAGHTLIKLLRHGFVKVRGVDVSEAMLDRARVNLIDAGYEAEGESLHLSSETIDLPDSLGDGIGAAFVNWTLHFVPKVQERKQLLQNISLKMDGGALLVLTEKTSQNDLTTACYHDFKRRNGLSDEEISVKDARLKGVLKPFPVQWYLDVLGECGFVDVTVFRAMYGFVTFLARRQKKEVAPLSDEQSVEHFHHWASVSVDAKSIQYENLSGDAPLSIRAWGESTDLRWEGDSAETPVYGYVFRGPTTLFNRNREFRLCDGMYFCCNGGPIKLQGGCGIIQTVQNHRALFTIGGPVEEGDGHLPYIDGCTDTLLLSPIKKGAPCLNHLHFPTYIVQTQHTHPSARSGIVIRGKGDCVCGGNRTPLRPGTVFVIPAHVQHAFETANNPMDVIAFHPDSDFGPSGDNHPMINRTMVGGVPASKIKSIQTEAAS